MTRSPLAALARFRQHRVVTAEEHAWALGVFGATLPPRELMRVSPALGLQRRPFTFPGRRGRITVHLGPHAADPLRTNPPLFAHELTHVWQLHHAPRLLPWLARAAWTQLRHTLGRDVYGIGAATTPWDDYTVEQQATVVERWVAGRHGPDGRRLEHYLDDHVRTATQPGPRVPRAVV